jgi:predicted MFS family arabinose efflux permease
MPDNERTRGMVTSLWFIFQCLGSYVGSSAGGFAFDHMGFKGGTMIVIALQVVSTAIIVYLRGTVKLRSTRTASPTRSATLESDAQA